jgi:hypothetical protein
LSSPATRRLLHVPIIHTQADMGSLGDTFKRALVEKLGEQWWQLNLNLVDRVWSAIETTLDGLSLDYPRVRVYQDGLPVCGHELRIVTELAQAGSRNHQLLLRLHRRGAAIMGTESAELLVEEYQLVKQLLEAGDAAPGPDAAMRRQELARSLLERRDAYIASRIGGTLKAGETAIVFLGLLHSLSGKLPRNLEATILFSGQAARPV